LEYLQKNLATTNGHKQPVYFLHAFCLYLDIEKLIIWMKNYHYNQFSIMTTYCIFATATFCLIYIIYSVGINGNEYYFFLKCS